MDPTAKRPLASMMLALRSLDWLMMADEAALPKCVAASKHTVSRAPRMMLAVTGSTVAEVASGSRLAARLLFNSNDMAVLLFSHGNRNVVSVRLCLFAGPKGNIIGRDVAERQRRPYGAAGAW